MHIFDSATYKSTKNEIHVAENAYQSASVKLTKKQKITKLIHNIPHSHLPAAHTDLLKKKNHPCFGLNCMQYALMRND